MSQKHKIQTHQYGNQKKNQSFAIIPCKYNVINDEFTCGLNRACKSTIDKLDEMNYILPINKEIVCDRGTPCIQDFDNRCNTQFDKEEDDPFGSEIHHIKNKMRSHKFN